MHKVAPHLHRAATRIANVWLLEDSSRQRFLIDSGHPIERVPLLAELFKAGIRMPGDLTAVLLTHRHSDHAGNAAWLRKTFGARIVCHPNDAGVLGGRISAPPLVRDRETEKQLGKQRFYERWLSAYEDRSPAFCEVDEQFEEGTWKWGFRVIPVPGHTEGSVMLYHEPTATLFSGDAVLSNYPMPRWARTRALDWVASKAEGLPFNRGGRALRLAEPGFSQDVESCHLAVQRFLRHLPPVRVLCPGHGPVVDENAETQLRKLAKLAAARST